MQLNRVLKIDDLYKIQAAIAEAGYNDDVLEIVMTVRTKDILKRINEELYYIGNKDGVPPEVDEISVKIGNIDFKYVLDEAESGQ